MKRKNDIGCFYILQVLKIWKKYLQYIENLFIKNEKITKYEWMYYILWRSQPLQWPCICNQEDIESNLAC